MNRKFYLVTLSPNQILPKPSQWSCEQPLKKEIGPDIWEEMHYTRTDGHTLHEQGWLKHQNIGGGGGGGGLSLPNISGQGEW